MIYINARFLSQKITGVQRFAREISKQLNKIRNDITFLVPSVNDVINFDDLEGGDILEVKGGVGIIGSK